MSRRVLILDTSILCCWLQVPGKENAGPRGDRWDHARVAALISDEVARKSTLVLPIATLIETGNHIAQTSGNRFDLAHQLAEQLEHSLDARSPWAAFTDQSSLWEADNLKRLASEWPKLAAKGLSIGDATIKDVAEYYAKAGWQVEILTGDSGLKAYEPLLPPVLPRRRR